ncbi:hypothetical protein B1987_05855 [Mycobacterium kansasii]|uniref:DUF4189 domain-containing protein n=1 Tax=Mycobacterium attenuatum TaxID=2341086 RepID=A0A498Q8L5_9MYCO|nr:DUF4189 domain-containing protein [Mycobacterium attenuatum]ORB83429.1 hypothetical protein B1987_05855 [Mycobacterium kansasii]VBA41319.1 hypothetical protein LAUMK136_03973 [Mycobacterium attenuatum]VBA57279.1 hypothetical protein LAUMK191_03948 [Mycobacterium attenuatum]VBA60621.1 hypothetical protein LAUMK41_04089 [Mycobacterium attenuatum]
MALTTFQRRAAVSLANVIAVTATILALAPAAEASNYVGAIAYSPTGKVFGRVKDAPSKAAAESAALSACGYSDCKVLVTFTDCGAIAENSRGDHAGGYGPTLLAAEQDAAKNLGTSGWIGTWYCN